MQHTTGSTIRKRQIFCSFALIQRIANAVKTSRNQRVQ